MSLFVCNACSEEIPSRKVRLQCQICPNYQQCTNCYVLSQVSGSHTSQHQITLHKLSGSNSTEVPPPLLQSHGSISSPLLQQGLNLVDKPLPSPNYHSGSADGKVLVKPEVDQVTTSSEYGQSIYAPPPYRIPSVSNTSASNVTGSMSNHHALENQAGINSSHQSFPDNPSSSISQPVPGVQRISSTQSSFGNQAVFTSPKQWQSLFNGTNPNAIFSALCTAFFWHVDVQHREYLTPETLSNFMDILGIEPHRNIWKTNLQPNPPNRPEDRADAALRQYFELLNLGYILRPRPRTAGDGFIEVADAFSNLFSSKSKATKSKPIVTGATMPCMTRKGFLDLMALEILLEPGKGWIYLKSGMRRFNIWPEYDEMPRQVLPEIVPTFVMERSNNALQQIAYQNDVATRQETLANEMARLEAQNRRLVRKVSGQNQYQSADNSAYLVDEKGQTKRF